MRELEEKKAKEKAEAGKKLKEITDKEKEPAEECASNDEDQEGCGGGCSCCGN